MGDTNCNFMDKSNNDTKNLLKVMNNYNLKQVIRDFFLSFKSKSLPGQQRRQDFR